MKDNDLADAICSLTCAVIALGDLIRHQNNNQAILQRIAEMENRIMSKISEHDEAMNAKFAEIGEGVDELVTAVTGISGDVGSLKEIILKLETNPGPISPEDQALLTSGVVKVTALAERVKALAAAAKTLDAATETPATPEPTPE